MGRQERGGEEEEEKEINFSQVDEQNLISLLDQLSKNTAQTKITVCRSLFILPNLVLMS